jgi:hypothetical protein
MLIVEFVCSKNVTRSPAYEAAAQRFVEENGLSDKIRVESSGIDVERMNAGVMAPDEMRLYLGFGVEFRALFPKYRHLSEMAEHHLRNGNLDSSKEAVDLAHKISLVVDTYCIQKSSEALLARGLVRTVGQRQTIPQDGSRVLIPVHDKYAQGIARIYGVMNQQHRPQIISATQFGPAQVPSGWKLEDFLNVVDIAIETTPKIIEHILKEK